MVVQNEEVFRRMGFFKEAMRRTLGVEGLSSYPPINFGVESYIKISRIHWPEWEGWKFVGEANHKEMIQIAVKNFYQHNFWDRFKGDEVASFSAEIAYELFDMAVELNVSDSVRILQLALNRHTKDIPELKLNGRLGRLTIKMLSLYLDESPISSEKSLLNCMRNERTIVKYVGEGIEWMIRECQHRRKSPISG